MKNVEVLKLFPEPIFKYKLDNFEEFNKELSKYIYQLKEDDEKKNITKSNKGGWHSPDFQIAQKGSIQNKFALEIQKYILNVCMHLGWKTENKQIRIASMWSIINMKDDFNVIHTHPNSFLSAAYYVKAPENCGSFKASNPNQIARERIPLSDKKTDFNMNVAQIKPMEGDLLLFPAYLPHSVGMNLSDEDRIVISFNIDILR